MLQQTQVATVVPYYQRFMQRFPDIDALADAEIDQVLHLWTGLGYYARARNLHRCARQVVQDFGGEFPANVDALSTLPGIGRSTAGAIAALALGIRAPILDGNVKRVLTRYFAVDGYPEQTAIKKQLWTLAESLLPQQRIADYTQAMMDLGSMVCTRSQPDCHACPLRTNCEAVKHDLIGSIPGKKPRKALPVRSVYMLIMLNKKNEVRLEKRPPSGIWGGLYSLPELTKEKTGDALNLATVADQLPPLRHTFSHFHLDITPVFVRHSDRAQGIAESDDSVWYPLNQSMEVGLAAPVKKILSQIRETL